MNQIKYIALCWMLALSAVFGCSAEYDEREGDTELVETGTTEQAVVTPPDISGVNIYPDNFTIEVTRNDQGWAQIGLSNWTESMFNLTKQIDAAPLGQKLVVSQFAPQGAAVTDMLVITNTMPLCPQHPAQGQQCWPYAEYFHISCFDSSTNIPGTSGTQRYRKMCQVSINQGQTQYKAVGGIAEQTLRNAAFCRALWFSLDDRPSASGCGKANVGFSFSPGFTTWDNDLAQLPTVDITNRSAAMRQWNAIVNPDPFGSLTNELW